MSDANQITFGKIMRDQMLNNVQSSATTMTNVNIWYISKTDLQIIVNYVLKYLKIQLLQAISKLMFIRRVVKVIFFRFFNNKK